MEVDRIWRIDRLDSNANPGWQNSARRRRKFVEEVAAAEGELDGSEEESADQSQPEHRDFASDDAEPAGTSPESGASFRVIA